LLPDWAHASQWHPDMNTLPSSHTTLTLCLTASHPVTQAYSLVFEHAKLLLPQPLCTCMSSSLSSSSGKLSQAAFPKTVVLPPCHDPLASSSIQSPTNQSLRPTCARVSRHTGYSCEKERKKMRPLQLNGKDWQNPRCPYVLEEQGRR
jgi:hypothetical protein